MRIDEVRRDVIIRQIAGEHCVDDANCEVFVDLKMQMGRVQSMRIAYGADLLPTRNLLAFTYENPVKMSIQ
jgi:hypothetical protein